MQISARHQIDGWSCGIWVARFWEECVRQRRGEPRMPVVPVSRTLARADEFMDKIRKAKGGQPGGDGPKPLAGPVNWATLEDALTAAHLCAKCRPRKDGMKGCRTCMGKWFDEIRAR